MSRAFCTARGGQAIVGIPKKMSSAVKNQNPNKIVIPPGYILANQMYLESLEKLIQKLPPFSLLWGHLDARQQQQLAPYLPYSTSQLAQDLFVISESLKRPIPPFFVEVGATNGISLSNTYILETKLQWQGIVVEPARVWHDQLTANRQCIVDKRCVTDQSHQTVEFLETGFSNQRFERSSPALSSIATFADSGDWATEIRKGNSRRYPVSTISLDDLLADHGAPQEIGYLSLDTEGSELMILQGYNFSSRKIFIVSVEHNFNQAKRQAIFQLMCSHGYTRCLPEVSRWDDWYVLTT